MDPMVIEESDVESGMDESVPKDAKCSGCDIVFPTNNTPAVILPCCNQKLLYCLPCQTALTESHGLCHCVNCIRKFPLSICRVILDEEEILPVAQKSFFRANDNEETFNKLKEKLRKLHERILYLEKESENKETIIKELESNCASLPAMEEARAEFVNERRIWDMERWELFHKIDELSALQKIIDDMKRQLVQKDDKIRNLQEEVKSKKPAPLLGIDIGTSNCCVAYIEDGEIHSIRNERDEAIMPSNLKFSALNAVTDDDPVQLGAKESSFNTVSCFKLLLCRNYDEALEFNRRLLLPFEMIKRPDDGFEIKVPCRPDERFSAEELCALFLSKLKHMAETQFGGRTVSEAVIVIPTNFGTREREALFDAADIAGFRNVRFIGETMAAVHAYKYRSGGSIAAKNILVVAMGGGFSEISYLERSGENKLCIVGSCVTPSGGEGIDRLIADCWREHFKNQLSKDVGNTEALMQVWLEVKEKSRKLKEDLSSGVKKCELKVTASNTPLELTFSRDRLEHFFKDFFSSMKLQLDEVLGGRLPPEEIIVSGGSMRIPFLVTNLSEWFPKARICKSINYGEAVAQGAALYGSLSDKASDNSLSSEVILLQLDVTFELVDKKECRDGKIARCISLPSNFTRRFKLVDFSDEDSDKLLISISQGGHLLGTACLEEGRFGDRIELQIIVDKNGVIEDVRVCSPVCPDCVVSISRVEEGLTRRDARKILSKLQNYWADVETRLRQKRICNKLDELIAFAENQYMSGKANEELNKKCTVWYRWFSKNSNESADVLMEKYREIVSHLASIGIEPQNPLP